MKALKLIMAVAVLGLAGMSTSCTKSDLAEEDKLYQDVQGIDKSEIKESDT